jgi:hypothetical protein
MHPRRKIKWILTSGLGNQLYGYFAGQYVAEKLNLEIKYLHNPLSRKHEQRNSNIRSFILNDPVRKAKTHVVFPNPAKRIFFGIKRRSQPVSKTHDFLIRKYLEQSFEIQTEIKKIEFELEKYPKRTLHVEGYFQDFSYFTNLRGRHILELRNPSEWHHTLTTRILISKPIVVHLRLGDYIEQPNIWGVLDHGYYEESLKRIRLDFPDNEIWIFSDNFERAKKLLKEIKGFDLNFIESSLNQDPAEVLDIMSKGIAHVVSNSTFSLWAAMMSQESELVVIPDPVFKNVVGQARGLPSDWIRISSLWASEAVITSLISSLDS